MPYALQNKQTPIRLCQGGRARVWAGDRLAGDGGRRPDRDHGRRAARHVPGSCRHDADRLSDRHGLPRDRAARAARARARHHRRAGPGFDPGCGAGGGAGLRHRRRPEQARLGAAAARPRLPAGQPQPGICHRPRRGGRARARRHRQLPHVPRHGGSQPGRAGARGKLGGSRQARHLVVRQDPAGAARRRCGDRGRGLFAGIRHQAQAHAAGCLVVSRCVCGGVGGAQFK